MEREEKFVDGSEVLKGVKVLQSVKTPSEAGGASYGSAWSLLLLLLCSEQAEQGHSLFLVSM